MKCGINNNKKQTIWFFQERQPEISHMRIFRWHADEFIQTRHTLTRTISYSNDLASRKCAHVLALFADDLAQGTGVHAVSPIRVCALRAAWVCPS